MFNRRLRLFWPLVLIIALPLLAQTRGGGVTIHYALAGLLGIAGTVTSTPQCRSLKVDTMD